MELSSAVYNINNTCNVIHAKLGFTKLVFVVLMLLTSLLKLRSFLIWCCFCFQVARCIGSHVSLLLRDLIILFKDDYIEVLKGLVLNLSETVDSFSSVLSSDRVTSSTNDLLQAVISCEQLISTSNDWRLQELLLDKLSCLTRIFSSDQIHNKLIPIVFHRLHHAVSLLLSPGHLITNALQFPHNVSCLIYRNAGIPMSRK